MALKESVVIGPFAFRSGPNSDLRSRTCSFIEPLRGFNPAPVMFTQPVRDIETVCSRALTRVKRDESIASVIMVAGP